MLMNRTLYKQVVRARAVEDRSEESYKARLDQLQARNLLTPEGRRTAEQRLAKWARVDDAGKVIIYVGGAAPGYQKVKQYVERGPGATEVRDERHTAHLRIRQRHLGLWCLYIFADPDLDELACARLDEGAKVLYGFENELRERRQGILFP